MIKGLKLFLSFFLAASVLFASTGIVIASHVCLKQQKTDVSLFESKSCCKSHHKSCSKIPVVSKRCCELSINYCKLEINSATKTITSVNSVSIPVMVALNSMTGSFSFQHIVSYSDDPPDDLRLLPGSKNFLHSIHLLLI
jgi:hypothetical protein